MVLPSNITLKTLLHAQVSPWQGKQLGLAGQWVQPHPSLPWPQHCITIQRETLCAWLITDRNHTSRTPGTELWLLYPDLLRSLFVVLCFWFAVYSWALEKAPKSSSSTRDICMKGEISKKCLLVLFIHWKKLFQLKHTALMFSGIEYSTFLWKLPFTVHFWRLSMKHWLSGLTNIRDQSDYYIHFFKNHKSAYNGFIWNIVYIRHLQTLPRPDFLCVLNWIKRQLEY